jgi:hypothetical protein
MKSCETCGKPIPEGNPYRLVCNSACNVLRRRKRDREIYTPSKAAKAIPRAWKTFKCKDSVDLPPPSRRQREIMLENLCRLFLDTGDEVKLIFGEASLIGSGHCKTGGEE